MVISTLETSAERSTERHRTNNPIQRGTTQSMSTPTSAEAPYVATNPLYDGNPTVIVTSLVEDDSSEGFIDITGKFQIVNGDHATVLDFSTYFDTDRKQGSLQEEMEAVNRFEAAVTQFVIQFRNAVNRACAEVDG